MNQNKLDNSNVFENYVVGGISATATGYAGIITNVEVAEAKHISDFYSVDDYSVTIKILVNKDNNLKSCQKVFRYVLTTGRTSFQSFISDFKLMNKDNNETATLHLEKLLGKIVEVAFGTTRFINNVKNPMFEDKETEEELTSVLMENAEISDNVNAPDMIKHYIIISVIQPENQFHAYAAYPAIIKKIDCFKDTNKPEDVTIRVSAYLLNGGKAKRYFKYFNCVHSKGKTEFDKFCLSFDSVDDLGKVDIDKILGRSCKAELTDNGKKYISLIVPDNTIDESILKIYEDIITVSSENKII